MVEVENISDHPLEEREEEKQEHLGNIRADKPKPNAALTTDEEWKFINKVSKSTN
jgi:hypothetical protein